MSFHILLAGVGQLGSRYLQGFAACNTSLHIHAVDTNAASLDLAAKRWQEVADTATVKHEVAYASNYEDLPDTIDLAVVASTADVRIDIVRKIRATSTVKYWLLEKVLCQEPAKIDDLLAMTADSHQAWVNTPRSAMPLYHQIRNNFELDAPIHMQLTGGNWGMACNAIHFLELLVWFTGETLDEVDTSGLDAIWVASKRPGFSEINGRLSATFSKGSTLALSCIARDFPLVISIKTSTATITVDEHQGHASDDKGRVIHGEMKLQSALSGPIADSILGYGNCDLPTLASSAVAHRRFLNAMLAHYRLSMDKMAETLPIT